MIAKPAILTCTRCSKIFIGWETDPPPKGGPTCLKCQARQAWATLASAAEPKKARRAGGKGAPARARARAKRSGAASGAGKRGAAKARKQGRAKARA